MMAPGPRTAGILRQTGFAAVGTMVALSAWTTGVLDGVNRSFGDALLRLTHRSAEPGPVAALVIDDRSVEEWGPLPWSRQRLGRIVESVREAGAVAVAIDFLLAEPGEIAGDRRLAAALESGPTVLAAALGPDHRWILPDPRFGGSNHAAHVHVEVAADGVARTIIATKQAEDLSLPAMSLAAARLLRPHMAVTPGAPLRPDFRPAPSHIATVSAADLDRSDASEAFAGRLVFIGVTATGAGDRMVVPTEPGPAPSAGVLVHASAAVSLLRGGLVRPVRSAWILAGILLACGVTQIARDRVGSFRPIHLALVVAAVASTAVATLQIGHLMLPVALLVIAPVATVLAREAVESRIAHRASGRLLAALLRHHGVEDRDPIPTSAAARLAALRELQTAVIHEDRARRTLLDGMEDGVVSWASDRRVVIANPAARRLWGGDPAVDDLRLRRSGANDDGTTVVSRNGRDILLRVVDLDGGGLALLRDVTAERELERRRRDMQRMVSHELKTPLASITGLGETLERYELDREEQRRVAALIRGESSRLGDMVATFLDLERLSSGGWEPSDEPVDLGELIERRLAILSEAARPRAQRIECTIEEGAVVSADPSLLERVVDNLVGNALKYSADGSTVDVAVTNLENDVEFRVADHGPGIPSDALPRLFERFYRVPGSRGGGSGLGLAVVDEIVSWHGGCITVDSAIGQGTTFTVRLPKRG